MSDKFQDIYRIPSARAEWWDYSQNGVYFVTICTAHREHYLGEIVKTIDDGDYPGEILDAETLHATSLPKQKQKPSPKQQMQLSEIGKIAHEYWMGIPNHFPFVKLDAFIVMPNHVHGIVIIDKPDGETHAETLHAETLYVETLHATSLPRQNPNPKPPGIKNEFMASISPKKGELGTIIRSYKSAVTQQGRKIHADFAWQTRFHEHIIRNEQSFRVIRKYIRNNPATWDDDQLNSESTDN